MNEIKNEVFRFRISENDLIKLKSIAKQYNLTTAEYLRRVALKKYVKSLKEHKIIVELSNINSNLGKIGGLLKLYIMDYYKNQEAQNLNVPELISELKKNQNQILDLLLKLHNNDNKRN